MIRKRQILIVMASLMCVILGLINSEAFAQESQVAEAELLTNKLIGLTRKPVSEVRQELEDTIDALATIGDPAIPVLMDYFNMENQEFGLRHAIVRVLAKIGSNSAKENLKEIAMSERKDIRPNLKEWAASHFIKLIQMKEEAVSLIDSNEIGVKNVALMAISGIRLNAELISKVDPLLTNDSEAIRWAAAKVYEEDPSEEFYSQKISSILRATARIYTYGDANEIVRPGQYSKAQISLQNYINALSNMNGPLGTLQQASQKTATELTKDVLLIARANRKDQSVKSGVTSIIQETNKDFILRLRAVINMGEIGTDKDIQFLQSLANTDPYQEKRIHIDGPNQFETTYYPIREAAKASLQKIQKQQNLR